MIPMLTRLDHAIHRGRRIVQRGNPMAHGIGAALAVLAAAACPDDAHCVHAHVVSIGPAMPAQTPRAEVCLSPTMAIFPSTRWTIKEPA